VKDALDYALYFISEYESNTEAIEELKVDISNIRTSISVLKEDLQREIDINRKGINNLSEEIVKINEAIVELNNAIENIDVDKNILNWIKNSLQNSKTIELKENNSLEVILST
jgi:chromosome segregation ATPase